MLPIYNFILKPIKNSFIVLSISLWFGAFLTVYALTDKSLRDDFFEPHSLNTPVTPQTSLPLLQNPRLIIKKNERRLELFNDDKLIRDYRIVLGYAPVGDKLKRGDGRTPEGEYYIDRKNSNSKFYLSLGLSYPNVKDAERGLRAKLITRKERDAIVRAIEKKRSPPQSTALGGDIFIHGGGTANDWTWGCIALENTKIKELFEALPVGTSVLIEP